MKIGKSTTWAVVLGAIFCLLGVLAYQRATDKGFEAVTQEEVEREKGIAVAAEHPVRMDLADYVYVDGELAARKRYMLRSKISETVTDVRIDTGEAVREGQLLVAFRDDDLKAEVAARSAAAAEAKRNYERYQALFEKGVVPEDMLDARRTAAENAAAALRAAKSRLTFAEVKAPAGKIASGKEGTVKVSERFVNPGEFAATGTRLLSLVDLSELEVKARVPERSLRYVGQEERIEFRIVGEKKWRSGKVKRIGAHARSGNQFVDIFVAVTNSRRNGAWIMRPGMYVEVRIPREVRRDALAVRVSTLRFEGTRKYVFLLSPVEQIGGGETGQKQFWRAEIHRVRTGLRSGGYTELRDSELDPEDLIVSTPRYDLKDGMKARVVKRNDPNKQGDD
ncbi:MAG: efflux RND transporter periplasmic adaptor subunit [Candidatus Brocadiia bacterium]